MSQASSWKCFLVLLVFKGRGMVLLPSARRRCQRNATQEMCRVAKEYHNGSQQRISARRLMQGPREARSRQPEGRRHAVRRSIAAGMPALSLLAEAVWLTGRSQRFFSFAMPAVTARRHRVRRRRKLRESEKCFRPAPYQR
jgi:hypothetical protein